MLQDLAVQIAAAFLGVEVLIILRYLLSKWGSHGSWMVIRPWLFLACSIVILALSAAFTLFLGAQHVLLAVALAAGVTLSILDPAAGLCFLLANLLLRPWELLPGNELLALVPKGVAGISVLSWLLNALAARDFKLLWSRTFTVFVLLLLWLAVSAMLTSAPSESLKYLLDSFFPISVITFLIFNVIRSERDLGVLRGSIIASVVGALVLALYITNFAPVDELVAGRLHGPGMWGNANDLAALVVLALPFVGAPFLIPEAKGHRALWRILLILLFLYGIWLSGSRGAVLSIFTAAIVYMAISVNDIVKTAVLVLLVLPIPIAIFLFIDRDAAEVAMSSSARWSNFVAGLRMVKYHPFFGVGIGNYPKLFELYTPAFIEWGERTAHSSWILVLAEAGIIGLVLFTVLYILPFRQAWQMRNIAPEYLLVMTSYGVAMSFLSHTYLLPPYLVISLVAVAGGVYQRRAEPPPLQNSEPSTRPMRTKLKGEIWA